jgi:hypothetical protein
MQTALLRIVARGRALFSSRPGTRSRDTRDEAGYRGQIASAFGGTPSVTCAAIRPRSDVVDQQYATRIK